MLVDKCKKLVGAFNHNNVLRKALHQVQQELAYSVRIQLQGECNTRFNYRYTMLDSIVSNEKALCQMLTNVTINKGLIGHANPTVAVLKACLLSSIQQRFGYVYDNEIFLAASFLDYKYKNFEFFGDATKSKAKLKLIKSYLMDLYKSNIVPNGTNSTQDSATVAQTQTQAQSQSQLTLTDNNYRRKQPGILLATQEKNIVKRKHALELELKMYQSFEWCSSDQELAKVHGPLLFYKQNICKQ